MKPNYCSGGGFASGRFSSLSNSSIYQSNQNSSHDGNNIQQQTQFPSVTPKANNDYFLSTSAITSPFIVYRSAKYVRPHARILQNLRNYGKYYVVGPATLFASQCKDAFYQLCGMLLLLATSPFWILMTVGLLIVRRLRCLLIKRLYPKLEELEHYQSSSTESPGVVNSIIWTRRKLDANLVRNRFRVLFKENEQLYNILQRKISSKLGAEVWERCEDFALENHVVETPKQFYNCPLVDEPLKELYRTGSNKSILQKYISFCISTPLKSSNPPWKIHVISYISREDGLREKTCLVIRMHVALIKNRMVQEALRELFISHTSSQALHSDTPTMWVEPSHVTEAKPEANWKRVLSLVMLNMKKIHTKIKKMGMAQQKSFTIWINLRLKQLEFHSKTVVLSLILMDVRVYLLQLFAEWGVVFRTAVITVTCYIVKVLTHIQALAAVPIIILASFLQRSRLSKMGLQKNVVPEKRLISWSEFLHADLVDEICERSGGLSPENVVMMACTYALGGYFQLNNIENPRNIGFTISSVCNPLNSPSNIRAIHVPGSANRSESSTAQKLMNIEEKMQNHPEWRTLGMLYIFRYLTFILPTCLAHKVQKSVVSSYPFLFTHINVQQDIKPECGPEFPPIRQLYGEIVEDFTLWPLPPLSDLSVSITLVHYAGKMRLYVMSPFQSMDTVLTHRCNQYLIKLAEEVGVDRIRIPYSRRTSPSSTSCSTPTNHSYKL